MKQNLIIVFIVLLVSIFNSCQKTNSNGKNSLLKVESEPSGENCFSGGLKIMSGIDINENNILDNDEVQATEFVCNGDDGLNGNKSLINIVTEQFGINCPFGGYKIITGVDKNNNDILDTNEIESEEFLCNGVDGEDGSNGQNGISSLINISPETAGEYCSFGGIKVEMGKDDNENGLLEENEIQSINYVCNGVDGQNSGAISTVRIPFI